MKIIGSSNVLGTNKLPQQIIGKSINPRAFKNNLLSADYVRAKSSQNQTLIKRSSKLSWQNLFEK